MAYQVVFLLQESERTGNFIAIDTANQIVCMFEARKFNDTQEFTLLNDNQPQIWQLL
jgi:hypothetical protein